MRQRKTDKTGEKTEKPEEDLCPPSQSTSAHHNYDDASDYKYRIKWKELMQNHSMRTTVTLDDAAHEFAAYYARIRGLSLSAAINELIRKAEAGPEPKPEIRRSPNGFPLLPRTGQVITSEMVKKYSEDDVE